MWIGKGTCYEHIRIPFLSPFVFLSCCQCARCCLYVNGMHTSDDWSSECMQEIWASVFVWDVLLNSETNVWNAFIVFYLFNGCLFLFLSPRNIENLICNHGQEARSWRQVSGCEYLCVVTDSQTETDRTYQLPGCRSLHLMTSQN